MSLVDTPTVSTAPTLSYAADPASRQVTSRGLRRLASTSAVLALFVIALKWIAVQQLKFNASRGCWAPAPTGWAPYFGGRVLDVFVWLEHRKLNAFYPSTLDLLLVVAAVTVFMIVIWRWVRYLHLERRNKQLLIVAGLGLILAFENCTFNIWRPPRWAMISPPIRDFGLTSSL